MNAAASYRGLWNVACAVLLVAALGDEAWCDSPGSPLIFPGVTDRVIVLVAGIVLIAGVVVLINALRRRADRRTGVE